MDAPLSEWCACVCRMDAPLVNVFVSELVRIKTGEQCEVTVEGQQPRRARTGKKDDIPKLSNDELTQLQDQMRKVVLVVLFHSLFPVIIVHVLLMLALPPLQ